MRPSQLLEEKRWPPLEILNNHQSKFQKLPSIDSPKIGSQAIQPAEWSSFMNNTSIIDYLSNNSNEPRNNSNSLKLEFGPPFQMIKGKGVFEYTLKFCSVETKMSIQIHSSLIYHI